MLTYHVAEWPHGLRCVRCSHPFFEGEPYSELLEGFQGDVPVTLIVCRPCALSPHDEVTG